ncbi:MAG: nuclear transport factor 2 family protein [Gammaproteobacteria bacterium]|nr:nuclear transport factor 2 family protein [Gammaproteobacteria bacterium]
MLKDHMARLLQVIDARDWPALRSLFTADLVYELPGRPPVIGIEQLMHYYEAERNIADGRHEIEGTLADGDHAMSWGRLRATSADGTSIDTRFVDLCHFRDSLIDRRTIFFFAPPG